MQPKILIAVCLSCLVLTGCVPKMDKATPISDMTVSADLNKTATDFDDERLVRDWWRMYGDEQLNTIVEEALAKAPSIQSLEAKFAQANTIIQSVESRNLPHVSANASVIRERFSENHIFPPPLGGGSYTQYQPELALEYDFDFWNARSSHILAAKNNALAQRATIEASKIALSSALCETYIAWHYDEQKRSVLNALEHETREELRIVEKQYALGLIDATAINDKKSSLMQIAQRVEELTRSIEGKKEALCVLGGFLPSYAESLKVPHIKNVFNLPLPKEIMLDLVAHRADVVVAKYTALSKSYTIEQTKAEFYPNISLSGLIGFTSFNWSKLMDHSSFSPSAGIAVSLPLLDWGMRKANLQNSVSDYNASVYEYNQAVIKAANEVVVLLKQTKLIQSQIQLHDHEMDAKRGNESITRKKLSQGLSDKLPYLSAKKIVYEGEIQRLSLYETKSLTQINLIKALGGGYAEKEDENASR